MKVIRILSLAAAAVGFLTVGACKSKDTDTGYMPPPSPDPGSYYSGK